MPNGAAANLAIGGALPVCTLSGKLAALASARPALSRSVAGISIAERGVLGERLRERDLADLGRLVVLVEHRRERRAGGRAAGAPARRARARPARVKRTLIGRIGRHGALARSRSQLKSAVNAARTVKREALLDRRRRSSDCSPRRCPCPRRAASRRRSAAGARSARAACARPAPSSMRRAFSTCARTLAADDPEREPLADALDLAPGVGGDGVGDRRRRSGAAGSAGPPRSRCRRPAASRRPPGRRSRTRSASFRSAPARWRRSRPARGAGLRLPASSRRGRVAVQRDAGAERLAKVVQPDAVVGPAAAARGNAALAGDRQRIGAGADRRRRPPLRRTSPSPGAPARPRPAA